MKTKHQLNLSAPVIQSGDQTQNNPMRRRWSALALGGFLFTSIFALSAPPVEAQCKRWDVSGNWVLQQANGINEQVSLQQGNWQQTSANLTGTSAVSTKPQNAGVISGNITDNAFTLLITRDTAQYRFTGTVGPNGKIEGNTSQGVHWVSSRRMHCGDSSLRRPHVPAEKDPSARGR